MTLDLKLTNEEKTAIAIKFLIQYNIKEPAEMNTGNIAALGDAIADAAAAKAALGVVAWLDEAFTDATEEKTGILNGDEVIAILTDLAIALKAAGIQKPETKTI